jgi:hypothetical protein
MLKFLISLFKKESCKPYKLYGNATYGYEAATKKSIIEKIKKARNE